jgi:hypothetical protein
MRDCVKGVDGEVRLRTMALMRALTRFGGAGVALVLLEARALAMMSSLLQAAMVLREGVLVLVATRVRRRDLLVLSSDRCVVKYRLRFKTRRY